MPIRRLQSGRPRRRRRLLLAGGMVVAALAILHGCATFGPPSTKHAFAGRPTPVQLDYDLSGNRRLHTAETGNSNGPLVLFIHGTPGGWSDSAFVMAEPKLAERAWLVSVDRLGWGGSAAGGLETSLAEQARALRAVLAAHTNGLPAIIVGHSLGGPVAARLAMDSPDLVGGLVIVAGALDPALEKTTWYQAVGRWPVVRWCVPAMLANADKEIIPLKGELQQMLPRWAELHLPVTVIQGESDALVSPANAGFAEHMMTNASLSVVRVPQQGHLIPWQRPDLIRDAILRQLDSIRTHAVAQ